MQRVIAPKWSLLPLLALSSLTSIANAQGAKPNILVIFGDDVGQTNISAYTHGLVGYKTPNIDRIAKEGMTFNRTNNPKYGV